MFHWLLFIILVGVAVFLISNTVMIGITVRHEEIAIMKYLGATDFFVRAPFLIEGMLIGLIGSLIPVCALKVLYEKVVSFMTNRIHESQQIYDVFCPQARSSRS